MAASEIDKSFADPPPESRMATYLWSFGPPGRARKSTGTSTCFRARESTDSDLPLYPYEVDDAARGIRNLPYLSPEFLDMLGYLARRTKEKGMEADLAMGSGWPYGGLPYSGSRWLRNAS